MNINIGKFHPDDAETVSALIIKTLRTVNIKDYPSAQIESIVKVSQAKNILKRAERTHFYVARSNAIIVGCGSIAPFWDREDESILFTIFVLPEYERQGIGRKIIDTLEQDEYFLRAKRIETPASITAVPFYLKIGYTYKDGITEPDDENYVRLEKYR